MKKYRAVIIIVEGHAEEQFVNESLRPWLANYNIPDVRAIKIRTSQSQKGGSSDYQKFKNDVTRVLNQEHDILVTSLIDFFRLPKKFPQFDAAIKLNGVEKQVEFLEQALAQDISSERFLPYIQLHEFEALLFANILGFKFLPNISPAQIASVQKIIHDYPNPELINNNPKTAPSKRLVQIFPSYKKVLHGNYIILENSFSTILEKCPRFSNWANEIIRKMNQ